jgi:hypothetical protein
MHHTKQDTAPDTTITGRRWTRVGVLALVTAATLLPAAAANANDADVVKRGSCSGSTDWKLKASPDDGRIEVEGQIDSNKAGQSWNWRLVHNGSLSDKGTKTTAAPSGSFEVRRVLVDVKGTDTIVFKAVNPKSDEVCRASLSY